MAEPAGTMESEVRANVSGAANDLGNKAADAIDRIERKVKNGGGVGDVTDEVKGAAGDLKSAAVNQSRQLYETARSQATSFADQRKNDAAQSVADLAASLRETGGTFGERPNIQAFVGSAADGLEQLADGLRDRSFAEIYSDVEDYCRRSPMTVAAGAAVAGFLLARFIKASSDDLSEKGAAARASAGRRATSPTARA